jgi:hypothetical protein
VASAVQHPGLFVHDAGHQPRGCTELLRPSADAPMARDHLTFGPEPSGAGASPQAVRRRTAQGVRYSIIHLQLCTSPTER